MNNLFKLVLLFFTLSLFSMLTKRYSQPCLTVDYDHSGAVWNNAIATFSGKVTNHCLISMHNVELVIDAQKTNDIRTIIQNPVYREIVATRLDVGESATFEYTLSGVFRDKNISYLKFWMVNDRQTKVKTLINGNQIFFP